MAKRVELNYNRFQADRVKIIGTLENDDLNDGVAYINYVSAVYDNGMSVVSMIAVDDLFNNFDGKLVEVTIVAPADSIDYGRRYYADLTQDEIMTPATLDYTQDVMNKIVFKSKIPYNKRSAVLDEFFVEENGIFVGKQVKPYDLFKSFIGKKIRATIYSQSNTDYGATTNPGS